MADIDHIINLRKKYVVELYESFNKVSSHLPAINQNIVNVLNDLMAEENDYWEKWQNRISKLERFNNEISTVNQFNLSHSKLVEIGYLRESFLKQEEDAKKHYMIVFSKLHSMRKNFGNNIIEELLPLVKNNHDIILLQNEIDITYPALLNHCQQWKSKPIEMLEAITYSIYEIDQLCEAINLQLQMYEANFINDDFPSLDKVKSLFFAEQCSNLSEKLEQFLKNNNIEELLNKLKSEESLSFKEEFADILGHKGLKSVRNNIRVVLNVSSTQKKLFIIHNTFKKLQSLLLPELQKLQSKKEQLIKLCSNAKELTQLTAQKWAKSSYANVFGQIDTLIDYRQNYLEEIETTEQALV